MLEILKETMRPSSISCILALVTPGIVLLHMPRTARWGRRWLTAVVITYWVLSCPLTVNAAARLLSRGYPPLTSIDQANRPQAIVMLSAGSINLRAGGLQLPLVNHESGLRALETARLFRLLARPLVIASGGVTDRDPTAAPEADALIRVLTDLGVDADRIVSEPVSKNTHDEAVVIREMLRERGLDRFVMVTSPLHMRRSMQTFEAQGLHPVPSMSPLTPENARVFPLLPNEASLDIGDSILYEGIARLYYWWNGWL